MLSTLPDEILLSIFQYLGSRALIALSKTCHLTRRLALDPSLDNNWIFHKILTTGKAITAILALDEYHIACGFNDGSVSVLDVKTEQSQDVMKGCGYLIYALSQTNDGCYLAIGSANGSVYLWDIEGKTMTTLTTPDNTRLLSLANLDNGYLAGCFFDSGDFYYDPFREPYDNTDVFLWNTATHEEQRLSGHSHFNAKLVAAPNGRLIGGTAEGDIYVWETDTKARKTISVRNELSVTALVFFQENQVVIGFDNGDVVLLNIQTDEQVCLNGHTDHVTSFALMQDGVLLSSQRDGAVYRWDLNSTEEKCLSREQYGAGVILNSTAQGTLISGSHDGTVCFWKSVKPNNLAINELNELPSEESSFSL